MAWEGLCSGLCSGTNSALRPPFSRRQSSQLKNGDVGFPSQAGYLAGETLESAQCKPVNYCYGDISFTPWRGVVNVTVLNNNVAAFTEEECPP